MTLRIDLNPHPVYDIGLEIVASGSGVSGADVVRARGGFNFLEGEGSDEAVARFVRVLNARLRSL